MNDRELLELAAKAAGLTIDCCYVDGGASVWMGEPRNSDWSPIWNPLTHDGDAFRLAVKLGIHLTNSNTDAWASTLGTNATEPLGADPYAATRRAIVRAAAEIARLRNERVL